MTSASAGSAQSGTSSNSQDDIRAQAEAAMYKIGDIAKQAANGTKESAATLASEATDRMKALMVEQVGAGAQLISHFAASTRVAANDLARNAPQLAGLVGDASRKMDQLSREIRGQSIDQLVRRTVGFARERPAVTFGAAAACGFFLFRLFKAGSATSGIATVRDQQVGPGTGGHRSDSPFTSRDHGQSHGA